MVRFLVAVACLLSRHSFVRCLPVKYEGTAPSFRLSMRSDYRMSFQRNGSIKPTSEKSIDCHSSGNLRTEGTITLLEQPIEAKECPLTRLLGRTKRLLTERGRDAPQYRLVTEVYTRDDTVQTLKQRLQEARHTLQTLTLNKPNLEHEISVKATSFFIDKNGTDMRKVFLSAPRLIGDT